MGAGRYPAAIIARWGSLLSDASSASLSTLHSFRAANGFSRVRKRRWKISSGVPRRVRRTEASLKVGGSQIASGSMLTPVAQGAGRPAVQFGKGFLLEVLKSSISRRTLLRRSNKQSSKRCSSSRSPYHLHGISSAMLCS